MCWDGCICTNYIIASFLSYIPLGLFSSLFVSGYHSSNLEITSFLIRAFLKYLYLEKGIEGILSLSCYQELCLLPSVPTCHLHSGNCIYISDKISCSPQVKGLNLKSVSLFPHTFYHYTSTGWTSTHKGQFSVLQKTSLRKIKESPISWAIQPFSCTVIILLRFSLAKSLTFFHLFSVSFHGKELLFSL